jgi:hypothetical protein
MKREYIHYRKDFVIETDPNITELHIICRSVVLHPQPNLVKLDIEVGEYHYKLPYFPKLEHLDGENIFLTYFDNLKSLYLSNSRVKNFKVNKLEKIELYDCYGKIYIPANFENASCFNCHDLRKAPNVQGSSKVKTHVSWLENKYLKKMNRI